MSAVIKQDSSLSVSPSSVRLLADPLKLDVSVNYGVGRVTSQGYEGQTHKNKVLLKVIASDLKALSDKIGADVAFASEASF